MRRSRPLPRLLRTLWYLRREQWAGQLRRRLAGPVRPVRLAGPPPALRLQAPRVPWLDAPPHIRVRGRSRLRLLNLEVCFADGVAWSGHGAGPLWAYHLHEMSWLRARDLSPEDRAAALRSWLAQPPSGPAWEPAPISLRCFAWLKLLTTAGALPEDEPLRSALLASLADQLATLERSLEHHLLGNHLLWNRLALVFAGVCLEGSRSPRWASHAEALERELGEQILPDGMHYERSPMYHALLLENLLDLCNALSAERPVAGSRAEREGRLLARLGPVAERMLGALAVLTHPDGEIALFGDAAPGVAHVPAVLAAYAQALGLSPAAPRPAGVLRAAGFARLSAGDLTLLFTAAPPMPSYQPGHAHCDALSFELSVGSRRVVTDTGVYEYVPGPRRELARATRSHATVEVEGAEQAELWAAHRIGGRPDVALTRVEAGREAEGVCAGWATPEVLHRRRIRLRPGGLEIEDRLDLPARRARLHLPLAPGLEPRLDGARLRLELGGGPALALDLPGRARWHVERRPCFPGFHREQSRAVLVGEAEQLAEARWRLHLG